MDGDAYSMNVHIAPYTEMTTNQIHRASEDSHALEVCGYMRAGENLVERRTSRFAGHPASHRGLPYQWRTIDIADSTPRLRLSS
jgi:hypothetical protein